MVHLTSRGSLRGCLYLIALLCNLQCKAVTAPQPSVKPATGPPACPSTVRIGDLDFNVSGHICDGELYLVTCITNAGASLVYVAREPSYWSFSPVTEDRFSSFLYGGGTAMGIVIDAPRGFGLSESPGWTLEHFVLLRPRESVIVWMPIEMGEEDSDLTSIEDVKLDYRQPEWFPLTAFTGAIRLPVVPVFRGVNNKSDQANGP